MQSDGPLVERARGGDRGALEELVRRHVGSVRAAVTALLGHHRDRDDLVQETMLRAVEDLARLRDPERFGPWLRGIARNLCRERIRKKKWEATPLGEVDELAAAPDSPSEGKENGNPGLLRAVASLPEKLKEAILLFYVESYSYDQIAGVLEITPAAMNRRLTRARQLLRERLNRREAFGV